MNAHPRPRRTRATLAIEITGVTGAVAGLIVLASRLAAAVRSPGDIGLTLAAMSTGYLLADLVTGAVHWFCDTCFSEDTPIIGPAVIAPFREHHRDPLGMTQHGFFELVGSSSVALSVVLACYLPETWADPSLALDAFLFALGSGGAATNLFHRWAHDPSPPAVARALQRLGIVLTPARHSRHHAPPYAQAYCVTSGWMNPVFDRVSRAARTARWFAA